MGSQPIRIQLRKFLRENLVGKSWGKFCGKSCRKFLQENLVGKSCGKMLQENLAGKSCGKILWENLAGKYCGKSCGKFCGKCCGKFPIPISKPFLKVIFKIYNSSRSTSFSLVNVKNSFLKPILNRFSHMTQQIKA